MSRATKRDLVGRKIVAVDFENGTDEGGRPFRHLARLHLDNGRVVYFSIVETGSDYAAEAQITERRKV